MYISDIFKNKKFVFSLEVFPPKKDSGIETIYSTLDELSGIKPDFISVTYGAGGNPSDNSTIEIAKIIKDKHGITPLPHLTCVNSDISQVDGIIQLLKENGIENVLALRGDKNPDIPPKTDFKYASDLTKHIKEKSDLNILGACYPETHSECGDEFRDIQNLKFKIENGATSLISQLFLDNNVFYDFMYKVRAAGITVPVQAGIMPVTNKAQIQRMVSQCGASLPKKFVKIINRYEHSPEALRDAGIAYATEQIVDLISSSADGVHIYTMNKPYVAHKIYDSIKNIVKCVNED